MDGEDPVTLILWANIKHRQLSKGQQAMIAAMVRELLELTIQKRRNRKSPKRLALSVSCVAQASIGLIARATYPFVSRPDL